MIAHLIGMFIIFASMVIFSIFQIYPSNPYNSFSITLIILGLIAFILCIFYFVKLNNRINPVVRRLANSNQNEYVDNNPIYVISFQQRDNNNQAY